jgi:hypothetical protein
MAGALVQSVSKDLELLSFPLLLLLGSFIPVLFPIHLHRRGREEAGRCLASKVEGTPALQMPQLLERATTYATNFPQITTLRESGLGK